MHEKVVFLGLSFDSITMNQTIEWCLKRCKDRHSTSTLMTINAALMMMMDEDSELDNSVRNGDLIVADGQPIVLSSKLTGTPITERVAGVDLMQNLLQEGHEHQLRFFFLGATQEVLSDLVQLCADKYPGLVIAGFRNGYFKNSDHSDVINQINSSQADILFIGMPSPFKEIWGEKYRNSFGVSVIFGVGGSFDVISGHVKRAPRWVQNIAMEWFWRMAMEPRKLWKRYLVYNSLFIYRLGMELVQIYSNNYKKLKGKQP
jgi:N-acetylglucosaminyldiphosphoundecaprenol N-acetyl-beta-D-mannosaminyltransferase